LAPLVLVLRVRRTPLMRDIIDVAWQRWLSWLRAAASPVRALSSSPDSASASTSVSVHQYHLPFI